MTGEPLERLHPPEGSPGPLLLCETWPVTEMLARHVYGFPGDGINGFTGALRRAEDSSHATGFVQARYLVNQSVRIAPAERRLAEKTRSLARPGDDEE